MQRGKKLPFEVIFLLGYLAYSSLYIARLNFSIASSLFEAAGILDKAQIGVIGGIFSFSYAISKVPNGYLGDRLNSRSVIVIGLLIASVSNLFIGLYPCFWSIAILWGVNAYGQSMLWGPMLRSFSANYSEEQFRKTSQLLVSSVATGSILGLLLSSKCASLLGASACFLIPSAVTAGMAILIRCFFINAEGKTTSEKLNLKQMLQIVCQDSRFRRIIFPAMSHGIIKDNINIWIAVFFIDRFGVDVEEIAGYIFFIPAFALIGRLMYPLLYRILKNDYYISATSFAVCAFINVLICMKSLPMVGATLCLGMISALVSIINTHMLSTFPSEFSSGENLSFVASLMDLLTYGGAGIGSLCFGFLIQNFGYNSMFLIWGTISGIAALSLLHSTHSTSKKP